MECHKPTVQPSMRDWRKDGHLWNRAGMELRCSRWWFILVQASVILIAGCDSCSGTDFREDIVKGNLDCFTYNDNALLFSQTCSVTWTGNDDFLTLKAHEKFDGNDFTVDMSDLNAVEGLFCIDNDVSSFEAAPRITRVHARGGQTSVGGGFLIRSHQRFFDVDLCSSTGNIGGVGSSGGYGGGGIAGEHGGQDGQIRVSDCYSTGDMIGRTSNGILGRECGRHGGTVNITRCSSHGEIASEFSGGLCGHRVGQTRGTVYISQCHSSGTISGVGAGGFTGGYEAATQGQLFIFESYSLGNMVGVGSGGMVAGISSAMEKGYVVIESCYSRGNLVGRESGGICGRNTGGQAKGDHGGGSVIVRNCYASGIIQGQDSGGIIGHIDPSAQNIEIDHCVYNGSGSDSIIGIDESGGSVVSKVGNSDDIRSLTQNGPVVYPQWPKDIWLYDGDTQNLPILWFQVSAPPTPSSSPSPTQSATTTVTATPTSTSTSSSSFTASSSQSATLTPSETGTCSATSSKTVTQTPSPSESSSSSATLTPSETGTCSATPSKPVTKTPSPSETSSSSATLIPSKTGTRSAKSSSASSKESAMAQKSNTTSTTPLATADLAASGFAGSPTRSTGGILTTAMLKASPIVSSTSTASTSGSHGSSSNSVVLPTEAIQPQATSTFAPPSGTEDSRHLNPSSTGTIPFSPTVSSRADEYNTANTKNSLMEHGAVAEVLIAPVAIAAAVSIAAVFIIARRRRNFSQSGQFPSALSYHAHKLGLPVQYLNFEELHRLTSVSSCDIQEAVSPECATSSGNENHPLTVNPLARTTQRINSETRSEITQQKKPAKISGVPPEIRDTKICAGLNGCCTEKLHDFTLASPREPDMHFHERSQLHSHAKRNGCTVLVVSSDVDTSSLKTRDKVILSMRKWKAAVLAEPEPLVELVSASNFESKQRDIEQETGSHPTRSEECGIRQLQFAQFTSAVSKQKGKSSNKKEFSQVRPLRRQPLERHSSRISMRGKTSLR
eukprot:gb/GECG01009623.1/.p1 GENE.gb/GECG01009623.1/~~gb/GECG01009623.1/.p1  ORF type:complete len:1009 (+),score=104.69 gb/GECG01009623.1/:1-3027(+)